MTASYTQCSEMCCCREMLGDIFHQLCMEKCALYAIFRSCPVTPFWLAMPTSCLALQELWTPGKLSSTAGQLHQHEQRTSNVTVAKAK